MSDQTTSTSKPMNPVTVEMFGLYFTGGSVKEAKAKATEILTDYFRAGPEFGKYKGVTYFLEPVLSHTGVFWAYSFDASYRADGPIHYRTMSFDSRAAARLAVQKHVDSLLADQYVPVQNPIAA